MASHKLFSSSPSSSALIVSIAVSILLLSVTPPALSLTCTSQNFTNNKLYNHCTDLPVLSSYLHWTYNSSNSSLSIAFIAQPPTSNGWISWAINPASTGMIGAQALIAFKQNSKNGLSSLGVNTYNLTSYGSITRSKLSFDVWDVSAEESSDGVMTLFAKVDVGQMKTVRLVNHVWQVGLQVKDGVPMKHEMEPMNMNAKGTLDLMNEDYMKSSSTSDAAEEYSWLKMKIWVYFSVFVVCLINVCFPILII